MEKLLDFLKGRVRKGEALSKSTWFQVGGPADILFYPADLESLQGFLGQRPTSIPFTTLGVGSNLIVRDGGVEGVVLRLRGPAWSTIKIEGDEIKVGAGALDRNVSLAACEAGLGGLEFLIGIPGTIGGGLRMNAGAYGGEIKDILIKAEALSSTGELHELSPEECGLSYRHCKLPQDWIFTSATLRGKPTCRGKIQEKMSSFLAQREATQPIRSRTGGSTFANPAGKKAWQLIDEAGCRGLRRGDAQVSELHCNFLINKGAASAWDLEKLGEEVQRRVFIKTGINLEWEIQRLGKTKMFDSETKALLS